MLQCQAAYHIADEITTSTLRNIWRMTSNLEATWVRRKMLKQRA